MNEREAEVRRMDNISLIAWDRLRRQDNERVQIFSVSEKEKFKCSMQRFNIIGIMLDNW